MALSKRKLSPYFLFGLLILLAWASFRIVDVFLDFVLVGSFLAYLTYPLHQKLRKRIKSGPVASILMLMGIVLVVVVPTTFIAIQLVGEIERLLVTLEFQSVDALVNDAALWINEILGRTTEAQQQETVQLLNDAQREFTSRLGGIVRALPGTLLQATLGIFVLLYIMYYAYNDGERLIGYLRVAVPMQDNHRDLLFEEVGNVVKAVMYGTVLTALIQATLGGIGFFLFGMPGVVLWSTVMFVLALLPIVGPPLVWVPASIYLFATGHTFRAFGLFVYSAIMVSSIDNLIRPKLIGSRAHVHPVVILLGVLGGIAVFGVSGFLLGPLILSVFVAIVDVYRKEFASRMTDEDEPYGHLG